MPEEKLPKKSWLDSFKQPKVFIPLGIFVIFYIGLNIFIFRYSQEEAGKKFFSNLLKRFEKREKNIISVPTPIPTPRPIKDIPGGKQVYNVSNGDKVIGPKIQQITIDPQTPTKDEMQTITITVKHDSPVTEATLYLQTDNKETKLPMHFIKGTKTDGTWETSGQIIDTYNYNYYFRFNLKSATGEYNDGPRLR